MLKQKKTDDQIVICCEYKYQINNFGFTTQPTNGNYYQQREVYERLKCIAALTRRAAVYLILILYRLNVLNSNVNITTQRNARL